MTIPQKSQLLRWHDAILTRIDIDQAVGATSVSVRPFGSSAEVIAVGRGVRIVSYSRTEPWGPSDFINSAILTPREGEKPATLEIEMQSGDKVMISAEDFIVREAVKP